MTNFTTDRLETWAGLGSWLAQYNNRLDVIEVIVTVTRDAEGHVPLPNRVAYVYGATVDQNRLHSEVIAAAPALAAALLTERRMRVAQLRRWREIAAFAFVLATVALIVWRT